MSENGFSLEELIADNIINIENNMVEFNFVESEIANYYLDIIKQIFDDKDVGVKKTIDEYFSTQKDYPLLAKMFLENTIIFASPRINLAFLQYLNKKCKADFSDSNVFNSLGSIFRIVSTKLNDAQPTLEKVNSGLVSKEDYSSYRYSLISQFTSVRAKR